MSFSCFSDFASKLGNWCVKTKESGVFLWDGTEKVEKCQFESDILTITGTLTITLKNTGGEGKKAANLAFFKLKSPFLCFFDAGKWAL